MDLAILVYAISVLSSIKALFVLFAFVIFCLVSILICYTLLEHEISSYENENSKEHKRTCRKDTVMKIKNLVIIGIIVSVSVALLPSEKTSYIMVAAYATQKVAEDQRTAVLSGKVLEIIENKLDSYLDDPKK